MNATRFFAYILLALGQAAIGLNVTVGKYVLQEMPLYIFLGTRFLITALVLTFFTLILKTPLTSVSHPCGKLEIKDWGFLTAQALTGGFLFNFLFFWGLEYTTATSAGIISSTLPAAIALCAYFCLGERLTRKKIFGILLAMLGIAVISVDNVDGMEGLLGSLFGDLLILLAIIPEALYSIFNKFIGFRVTPLGSGAVVSWLIFLMLLPLTCITLIEASLFSYSLSTWGFVILTGISSAFFFWAWPKGLLVIPAASAAIFGGVMPVVTSLLAYFFLGEDFGWTDATGMVLVFASLVLGTEWTRTNVTIKQEI